MLNKIRYMIADKLALMSLVEIQRGDFKSVIKGIKYFKYSIIVLPRCKDKEEVIYNFKKLAEDQQQKINKES